MVEVAAERAALPDGDVAAEQERRDEAAADRRGVVHLLLEQPDQDRRALGVADEDDPAAVVVVGEVVAESGEHAPVGDEGVREGDRARVGERAQRDLAVHGRVDATYPGEAGGLRDRHLFLAEPDGEVGVDRRLVADRRVDVEAVDPRVCRRRALLDPGGAVRRDERRRLVGEARVLGEARPAEPGRPEAVGRRGGGRRCGQGRCRLVRATAAGQPDRCRDEGDGDKERRRDVSRGGPSFSATTLARANRLPSGRLPCRLHRAAGSTRPARQRYVPGMSRAGRGGERLRPPALPARPARKAGPASDVER